MKANTSEEFHELLAKAAAAKTATFVLFNDTEYVVYDINHGWEYRTGGGLVSVGNRLQPRETLTKATSYDSGCMVRCIGNYKVNGKLYPNFRSRDADEGKCFGTYRLRLYVQSQLAGRPVFQLEVIEDEAAPAASGDA